MRPLALTVPAAALALVASTTTPAPAYGAVFWEDHDFNTQALEAGEERQLIETEGGVSIEVGCKVTEGPPYSVHAYIFVRAPRSAKVAVIGANWELIRRGMEWRTRRASEEPYLPRLLPMTTASIKSDGVQVFRIMSANVDLDTFTAEGTPCVFDLLIRKRPD